MTNEPARWQGVLKRWDVGFGVVVLAGGFLAWFVWFPNDIQSGFLVKDTFGELRPGDAFFPYLLVAATMLLAFLDLVRAAARPAEKDGQDEEEAGMLSFGNLRYLLLLTTIIGVCLGSMYLAGPTVVWLINVVGDGSATYRELIDTAPYKYIGFLVGGTALPMVLIVLTERAFSRNALLAGVVSVIVLIGIFDVLLTNIPLPPNGDY